MLIQSIYYPFEMVSRRKQGTSLQPHVHILEFTGRTNGEVTLIDSRTILDSTQLYVIVANRGVDTAASVTVNGTYQHIGALERAKILTDPYTKRITSYENQNLIKSYPFDQVEVRKGKACFNPPPLSSAAPTLEVES